MRSKIRMSLRSHGSAKSKAAQVRCDAAADASRELEDCPGTRGQETRYEAEGTLRRSVRVIYLVAKVCCCLRIALHFSALHCTSISCINRQQAMDHDTKHITPFSKVLDVQGKWPLKRGTLLYRIRFLHKLTFSRCNYYLSSQYWTFVQSQLPALPC